MAVGILASGDPVGVRRGDEDDKGVEEDRVVDEDEDKLLESELVDVVVGCDADIDVVVDVDGDVDVGSSVVTGIEDAGSDMALLDGKKGITVSSKTVVELADETSGDDRVRPESVVVSTDWLDEISVELSPLDAEVDEVDDCGGTNVITVAPSSTEVDVEELSEVVEAEVVVDINGPSVMELKNEFDERVELEEEIPSSLDVGEEEVDVNVISPEGAEAPGVELVDCVSSDVVENTAEVDESLRVVLVKLLFWKPFCLIHFALLAGEYSRVGVRTLRGPASTVANKSRSKMMFVTRIIVYVDRERLC
ncbi:hypothetical protein UCRPA7_2481 [Phaeoacremonium minimum UCRPA7]|uniref:Uncharacterized protein n=1 Tax=Phaeoacremonium minimum (strain UCR-PA7) TaxID=1286976 RepID=R8BRK2_PHAM7|nr:hypothetical protein UCRPA7_2481 [Phaeoacremonium minimum UCRPA7]EOO01997.1 hypothetical protein UCRPA7_2481 [Phaeoacremonium minimum UCRPA7]